MKKIHYVYIVIFTFFLGIFVFYMKNKIRRMEKEVYKIDQKIELVDKDLMVLRAEWAFLTTPENLKKLVNKRILNMEKINYKTPMFNLNNDKETN